METQPWATQYKPKKRSELKGNEEAVKKIEKWIKRWDKKPPKKRALFIHGPPGTGKTCTVQILAEHHGYDLLEINASDTRNKKGIEEKIGKNINQTTTLFGKKRMILLDEMEGVSGNKDRGGIAAITKMIKATRNPVILIATTIEENMEDKFRSLLRNTTTVKFKPIPFSEIFKTLQNITQHKEILVEGNALDEIAMKCEGDIRSAINDLETAARGKKTITPKDVKWISKRDKQNYTPQIIHKIFTAETLYEARKTISQSMIRYEDLFDWIYENLPIIIDEPTELNQALQQLSNADITQKRARTSSYRLLKYMFNQMTGGIALSRKKSKGTGLQKQLNTAILKNGLPQHNFTTTETPDGIALKPNKWLGRDKWGELNKDLRSMGARWVYGQNIWVMPYIRKPQLKWRYITTYHSRRKMKAIAGKLAKQTHTSTQEAITETLPLLRIIYKQDLDQAQVIDKWLDLEDKEQEFMQL